MSSLLWSPDSVRIKQSAMTAFMQYVQDRQGEKLPDYDALYQWSIDKRPDFWQAITDFFNIRFYNQPTEILGNDSMPGAQWFPGATLNYAEHLLQRRDDYTAITFRGEAGNRSVLTFKQLYEQVAAAQAGLIKQGVGKNDRVAGILPNCPEAIIMMLATTSLGAIWSSCSPDFGNQGIIDRFGQIEPKVLMAVDGYFYNGKAIGCTDKITDIQSQISSIKKTVLLPFTNNAIEMTEEKIISYGDFLGDSQQPVHFEPVSFDHPLFIMYSSGTTGVPKCIVHGHGGTLLQHLKELALHTDIKASDKVFYFTTCGWMMWNWLVSSLALGATVVLFDGSPFYPAPSALMDLAEQEGVSVFGASAKYISALEKAEVKPFKSHNLSQLKTLLSTGSPLSHESFDYVYRDIKKDLCLSSISGGTDIISCFVLGCPLLPVYGGEIQCRGLGMDVQFVNHSGKSVLEEKGELTCQSSFPSMPVAFWNDPEGTKYHNAYFNGVSGIWNHGDYGELTENKGVVIYGRSDAVLNPGGVRIGTAEIYRQVEKVDEVLESIAIGQDWQDDIRVVLFVKLREGLKLDESIIENIKTTIRTHASPRHVPGKIVQVDDIPRTISGKIVELAVREVVHGRPVVNKEALANPEALLHFQGREELNS
ncbi:acetoacetate--CoA ligase [Endozoicomonas sp. Mp262]|uniref:acetoacetate--CoA ligase n=1 Tax=Endozoicomonas sp. Mp262 TaxID=2919499 RepID=UPI0021E02577